MPNNLTEIVLVIRCLFGLICARLIWLKQCWVLLSLNGNLGVRQGSARMPTRFEYNFDLQIGFQLRI
ncbi:MAG: hypothetical protein ABIK33_03585 [candidate division WOR-3 bacterium]